MGVYIPGIKLPKDEPGVFKIIVMYVGVDRKLRAECEGTHEVTAVPEHGRLIDADALMKRMWEETDCMISVPATFVRDAPTIIPAEEE